MVEIRVERAVDSIWNTDGYMVAIRAINPRKLPTEEEITKYVGVRFYLRDFVNTYESKIVPDFETAVEIALKLADWLQC